MKVAVEIYAGRVMDIKEGAFFRTALVSGGKIMEGSEGFDSFGFASVITSEKRIAGLGREFSYTLDLLPAGMGAVEARPGSYIDIGEIPEDIALELETNLILDPGVLSWALGIRLAGAGGKSTDIPLGRPDVTVWWEGRGRYAIPLYSLLKSNILRAVS